MSLLRCQDKTTFTFKKNFPLLFFFNLILFHFRERVLKQSNLFQTPSHRSHHAGLLSGTLYHCALHLHKQICPGLSCHDGKSHPFSRPRMGCTDMQSAKKAERALPGGVKQPHALTQNALWMEIHRTFHQEKSYTYDLHIPFFKCFSMNWYLGKHTFFT